MVSMCGTKGNNLCEFWFLLHLIFLHNQSIGVNLDSNSQQLAPTVGQSEYVNRRTPWVSSGISRNSLEITI
jgi:hypothetical protein